MNLLTITRNCASALRRQSAQLLVSQASNSNVEAVIHVLLIVLVVIAWANILLQGYQSKWVSGGKVVFFGTLKMVDEFLVAKLYVLYLLSPELFTQITNSRKLFLKVTYLCLILRPVTLFSYIYNKQKHLDQIVFCSTIYLH